MMGIRPIVLGVLLLTADVAHAEEGLTFLVGVGVNSCGALTSTVDDVPLGKAREINTASGTFVSENARYQQWLMGFVSGYNLAHTRPGGKQLEEIDLPGIDWWMRNWCSKHPTKKVVDGAVAFVSEMLTNAPAKQR
jgi:hypothetical protein